MRPEESNSAAGGRVVEDDFEGPSLYWFDLETSGTNPRWDRIVQFAGFRTDLDLNEVGGEYTTYVHLPIDVLPDPDATLVTGITPELTLQQGIDEWTAVNRIHALLARPGTCGTGFNSLRFDDEFVRYALYRTLHDPYTREWQNGNSRWDLIDLVRATGALRPEGIEWPTLDDAPSFKLELMAAANGLDHRRAHDALSDVKATVALARLIRDRQPRLFQYYFENRHKKAARRLLEPYGAKLCVHVSGMYSRERHCLAPVVSLCRHPTNTNAIVVADLGQDIDPIIDWSADEIAQALFTPGSEQRPPLKEIRVNRCPFVAGIEVLTDENRRRLGIDLDEVRKRRERLLQPGIARKLSQVYGRTEPERSDDVDAELYGGFLKDLDRHRCLDFRAALNEGRWPTDVHFDDPRLEPLSRRLKARSFPEQLTSGERAEWLRFVAEKLGRDDGGWLGLAAFRQRVAELQAEQRLPILDALESHAQRVADEIRHTR